VVWCQFFQHETKYVSYEYCHILFVLLWYISKYLELILYESPCIILANDQLDAQFFFLICLLQFSTCFEQHRAAHHQEN
jgi:hypothetical protein